MAATAEPSNLIRVGVLTRPFGVLGGLRCELDVDAVPIVTLPADAWVGFSESFLEKKVLVVCDRRPTDMICYFEGVRRREEAEPMIDKGLWLAADVITYDDTRLHPRMIGYDVVDESSRHLGTITSIVRSAAHPLWGVTREGVERLLPAVADFICQVDHDKRCVVVRLIPGLLDDDFEVSDGNDAS